MVIAHIFLPLFMLLICYYTPNTMYEARVKALCDATSTRQGSAFSCEAHKVRSWSSQSAGTELDLDHRRLSSGLVSV